ncbi:MAG: AAA family ATPase [Rhodobacteraceae bacterium]|nr:AAA family ATPase [Paracoccaceae bacterium]
MKITRIRLKNWRNFKEAETEINSNILYVLGANATGKSNFLDALRFLRDVCKPKGGGLQTAIATRGGFSKIRCLFARGKGKGAKGATDLGIDVDLADAGGIAWHYQLHVNFPGTGKRELARITLEKVVKKGAGGKEEDTLLKRPSVEDEKDPERLHESHLEQLATNKDFRGIADFFSGITYVHLVPQLVKYGDRIGGHILEEDPFGQAFMQRIAQTAKKTRDSMLKKIAANLKAIVPGMEGLEFIKDENGFPHLEMLFKNYRRYPARQREDQFSDGTLRLVALMWLLLEKESVPLLLEEPELSLNEEIVAQLHTAFARLNRTKRRQIFISTHSYALLNNPGIDWESILRIGPTSNNEGSRIDPLMEQEKDLLRNGIPPSDALLPRPAQQSLNL